MVIFTAFDHPGAVVFPQLGLIAPHLPALRPHVGAVLARMGLLGPYVERIAPHLHRILPHTRPLLLQLDELAPHLEELTRKETLEALLPHMAALVPHLAALSPHLPQLVARLPELEPMLPELIDALPLLLPHLGPLLQVLIPLLSHASPGRFPLSSRSRAYTPPPPQHLDVLLPKLPELLKSGNKELLLPNLHRLTPHLGLASAASVNGLAAVASAAVGAGNFLSSLKKKLFREAEAEEDTEAEPPPADLDKVETIVGATSARLVALESTLFAFKNDLQFKQQQQTEAAVRQHRQIGLLPYLHTTGSSGCI